MTKLLEQAIAEVLEQPEETQNMAADALLMVIDHVNDDAKADLRQIKAFISRVCGRRSPRRRTRCKERLLSKVTPEVEHGYDEFAYAFGEPLRTSKNSA